MPLSIHAYGHERLRNNNQPIEVLSPRLTALIDHMWATLQEVEGYGLAAPQIGESLQLFIIDSRRIFEDMDPESRQVYFPDNEGVKEVFINAKISAYSEKVWEQKEACLSIPGIEVKVTRPWQIKVEYLTRNLEPKAMHISGVSARVIQHEVDHTSGILHIDYLRPLRRKLIQPKLNTIQKGRVKTSYPMIFK